MTVHRHDYDRPWDDVNVVRDRSVRAESDAPRNAGHWDREVGDPASGIDPMDCHVDRIREPDVPVRAGCHLTASRDGRHTRSRDRILRDRRQEGAGLETLGPWADPEALGPSGRPPPGTPVPHSNAK